MFPKSNTDHQALDDAAEVQASIEHLEARLQTFSSADRIQREELFRLIALLSQNTKRLESPISLWRRRRPSRDYEILSGSVLFDAGWYLLHNKDVLLAGVDPVQHYLQHGAREGRRPGPYFDGQAYLEANPDVAQSGQNPLLHFLNFGAAEGRSISTGLSSSSPPVEAATSAELYCLKFSAIGSEVALLVTHAPDGYLRPHTDYYATLLGRNQIQVVLIVITNGLLRPIRPELISTLSGLFLRENKGYDFAAWAHVLRVAPQLFLAKRLYLLNDSVFGPLNEEKFSNILIRVRASSADLVGLTDSTEYNWHIQSYFLAFKLNMMSSHFLRRFVRSAKCEMDKDNVVKAYELPLAQQMCEAGMRCEALFKSKDYVVGDAPENISLHNWKELIRDGFPFVKVMALRDGFGSEDWRQILANEGYNVSLVDSLIGAERNPDKKPSPPI